MCDKKVLPVIITSFVLAFSPLQAFAVETTMPQTTRPLKLEKMEMTDKKDAQTMTLMQPTIRAQKLLLRPTMKLMPMEEQMTKMEQKAKLRQQTFRSRLTKLKDENKKATLLNIDTKIGSISAHSLMVMSEAVNRMTNILNSVKEKGDMASSQGINTDALDAAIAEAETALDVATKAITEVSGKTYNIPVTSDEAAKTNAGQAVSEMRNDLTRTHQKVMDAKQALKKVLMELKKVLRQMNPNAVTPTASTTERPLPTMTSKPTVQPTAVPSPTVSDEEQPAE